MIEELRHAPAARLDDVDPLLCDGRIAQEYALFQFNNMATAIVGHAQLALSNPTYESLKRSALVSAEYGQKVADLARSLLVFSRGSAGDIAPTNLNDILVQALNIIEAHQSANPFRVGSEFHDVPPVRVDPTVIREVFLRLLTLPENAGPAAAVHVRTDTVGTAVRVNIQYSGMKVAREELDQICVPLFGAGWGNDGAGKGQGGVTVDLREGAGHVFTLTVCIPCPEAVSTKRFARVLVVDDEPVILSIFSRVIKQAGHIVEAVNNGREAIERMRNNPYDIVLLDWMMPEMSGSDVLREMVPEKPDLPFVIVTAAYSRKVAHEAIEAGARECIGKPLNHKKVIHLIERYSGAVCGCGESEEGPSRGQGEVLMVADPDALTRDLYHLMLDHSGYESHMAASYEDAAAAVEREYFDAILINDLLLRPMGERGIANLRRLNPYTPIIIMGDVPDERERQRTLAAGAAAFMEKPLELDRFLRAVRRILDIYREPSASRHKL